MCVRPQLLVCTWLGSSGPDLGPGEHTRSEGLVVGPGPAVVLIASIDNIVVSTYGVCAVGRWIQIGGMFFQWHRVRASGPFGTSDILFLCIVRSLFIVGGCTLPTPGYDIIVSSHIWAYTLVCLYIWVRICVITLFNVYWMLSEYQIMIRHTHKIWWVSCVSGSYMVPLVYGIHHVSLWCWMLGEGPADPVRVRRTPPGPPDPPKRVRRNWMETWEGGVPNDG